MTVVPTTAAPLIQLPSLPPQQRPFIPRRNQTNRRNQPISLNPQIDKTSSTNPASIVSWTSSISTLCRNGRLAEAVSAFSRMLFDDVTPNHITFIALLSGCADFPTGNESLCNLIHGFVCKLGLDRNDVMVGTALVGMYAKRGCVGNARLVFDSMEVKNSVTWNTMIGGYMRNGEIDDAVKVFDEMPERDLISWTALINGFVKRGCDEEALDWFHQMQISQVKPDYVTVIAVLAAISNLGALNLGLWVHRFVLDQDFKHNVKVSNSLIDMYARCGCIEFAREVFDTMQKRTLVSWNSIISGFAANGYAQEALNYFDSMRKNGIKPDGVTFTGALTACSHAGMVEEGLEYFDIMKRVYRITPRIEHYGCLVDLYSRAGRLEDALNVIEKKIPMKPNEVVIGSLLAACRSHENSTGLAERLMNHLEELGLKIDSNYVILSNMYAADQKWDGANRFRRKMKGLGLRKRPGFSSIEIGCGVHEFVASDLSHVESDDIYGVLELLSFDLGIKPIEEFVYIPFQNCSVPIRIM